MCKLCALLYFDAVRCRLVYPHHSGLGHWFWVIIWLPWYQSSNLKNKDKSITRFTRRYKVTKLTNTQQHMVHYHATKYWIQMWKLHWRIRQCNFHICIHSLIQVPIFHGIVLLNVTPMILFPRTTVFITLKPWWRHNMETLFAMLFLCRGNPLKGPIMLSLNNSFDVSLNNLLKKQSHTF